MLLIISSTETQSQMLLNTAVAACFKKWSVLQGSMSIRTTNIQSLIAANIYLGFKQTNARVGLLFAVPSQQQPSTSDSICGCASISPTDPSSYCPIV